MSEPLTKDKEMTEEFLNAFRKEVGNAFYVPENHMIFAKVADTNLWLREVFVWKYKKDVASAVRLLREGIKVNCDKRAHSKAVPDLLCSECGTVMLLTKEAFGGVET